MPLASLLAPVLRTGKKRAGLKTVEGLACTLIKTFRRVVLIAANSVSEGDIVIGIGIGGGTVVVAALAATTAMPL
jgi:hypothetical protein